MASRLIKFPSIPFGTDLKLFRIRPQNDPSNRVIFLYVGALQARKGLPVLLEAWRQIESTESELWIVGGGQMPDGVPAASANVRWFGRVSRTRLAKIYQEADVFVFPSYFEGLAQVLVEAAACGLPIVTTEASGGEEIVMNAETGYLVEAGSSEHLRDALSKFLSDRGLAQKMRERRNSDCLELSWSAYGDRWRTTIQTFLSGNQRSSL